MNNPGRLEDEEVIRELVEEVFNLALTQLRQLPPAKYRQLIKQMLLGQELTGDEQVVVAEEDKKYLGNGFLAQINQELEKQGQKGQIELVFDEQLSRGGFILRRNMVEDNNSFAGLLRAKRDELELAVAQVLFGE